jgi:hypothetical protein
MRRTCQSDNFGSNDEQRQCHLHVLDLDAWEERRRSSVKISLRISLRQRRRACGCIELSRCAITAFRCARCEFSVQRRAMQIVRSAELTSVRRSTTCFLHLQAVDLALHRQVRTMLRYPAGLFFRALESVLDLVRLSFLSAVSESKRFTAA